MQSTPDFLLTIAGADITDNLKDRLIDLTLLISVDWKLISLT